MSTSEHHHDPGGRVRIAWPSKSVVQCRFSPCGRYRYELSEVWDTTKPLVMWLLMNPSVAGMSYSDPTLRRTGDFSRAWGYGGQLVGNVCAYRATDKSKLLEVADPVGSENDAALLSMAVRAAIVVLAHGVLPNPLLRLRSSEIADKLVNSGVSLNILRQAKIGTPMHPLYLPGNLRPVKWEPIRRRCLTLLKFDASSGGR